jgi:hypothetical protein
LSRLPLGANDPDHLGAYQLLARLSPGGMGTVFLGRAPQGRLVAIPPSGRRPGICSTCCWPWTNRRRRRSNLPTHACSRAAAAGAAAQAPGRCRARHRRPVLRRSGGLQPVARGRRRHPVVRRFAGNFDARDEQGLHQTRDHQRQALRRLAEPRRAAIVLPVASTDPRGLDPARSGWSGRTPMPRRTGWNC